MCTTRAPLPTSGATQELLGPRAGGCIRARSRGDTAFADAAVRILDAWSATLTGIDGTSDKFLASGLYGYQLANAAEIMRLYPGWSAQESGRDAATTDPTAGATISWATAR